MVLRTVRESSSHFEAAKFEGSSANFDRKQKKKKPTKLDCSAINESGTKDM